MATNMIIQWTKSRALTCSYPATPASGDPVVCGKIPGVALAAEDTAGVTTVALDGQFTLSVKGEDASGNSAVADGDILYYEQGQTPPVDKDATNGVRFGYARGAVVSGATTSIAVEIGY